MIMTSGVTINGKHNYDYGLHLGNNNPVSPPEVRSSYIEVPGRNGNLDITEYLAGYTIYGNREITLRLGGKKPANQWPSFISNFLNEVHGKTVSLIFDDDKSFYYIGRATVESDYTRGNLVASFTVTVDAEPYKYELLASNDRWLWDPFSFVDGVARDYTDIQVSGNTQFVIVGSIMPVIPVFIVTGDVGVIFEGTTYQFLEGRNKFYDIVLFDQKYYLTFFGQGSVEIEYRVGRL